MAFWTPELFGAGAVITPGDAVCGCLADMHRSVGTTYAAWPSANLAIYVPIRLPVPVIATIIALSAEGSSGNIDLGIYDAEGTRIVSAGSTAHGGFGLNSINITDTLIGPGLFYLAAALDNATGTTYHMAAGAHEALACGVVQEASAFPLPATATFASMAQAYIPLISLVILPRTFL